jgi:hypothetical protein
VVKRIIYSGWDNYSKAEQDIIQSVKDLLREKHDIDLSKLKEFGPRNPNGICHIENTKIVSGRDELLTDEVILRYCIARKLNVNNILPDLLVHLEWRQTNIPRPILQDSSIPIIESGIFYLHGRQMDYTPIVVLNLGRLNELL